MQAFTASPYNLKRPTNCGSSNIRRFLRWARPASRSTADRYRHPIVKIDRGGQVTYHGPGQVVIYLLLDLHRMKIKVRELVTAIEQAVIDFSPPYGVTAQRLAGAPGVYVGDAKIAALGLKIKNGCSYHGLSLNVDMDLSPFAAINPCGYAGLKVSADQRFQCSAHRQSRPANNSTQHLLQQLDKQHG
jgi:lipoyl(octanoyl) transferase